MTPSLLNLPAGCAFSARCSYSTPACEIAPVLSEEAAGRQVRCHHPLVTEAV